MNKYEVNPVLQVLLFAIAMELAAAYIAHAVKEVLTESQGEPTPSKPA